MKKISERGLNGRKGKISGRERKSKEERTHTELIEGKRKKRNHTASSFCKMQVVVDAAIYFFLGWTCFDVLLLVMFVAEEREKKFSFVLASQA